MNIKQDFSNEYLSYLKTSFKEPLCKYKLKAKVKRIS